MRLPDMYSVFRSDQSRDGGWNDRSFGILMSMTGD